MAMIDMQPQELQLALQGLAAKDGDAFSKIYIHYRDQIYRFSRTLMRDDATAEDVAGDVFYDLLRKPIISIIGPSFPAIFARLQETKRLI